MSEKTLFVDDEQKVLNAISRQFDDVIEFETALGPDEALAMLDNGERFAVIVSDMRMPGMSGVELLAKFKESSPDTVRMILTGYADLNATIQAVNDGNIFRFLSKPCPQEVLVKAVRDALAQYRLVTAERELLTGTLQGSINVLSEMLSLASPLAFGRTSHVQRIAMAVADELELQNKWDLNIATQLFPLGCVTLSDHALQSLMSGEPVSASEKSVVDQHALVGRRMLEQIPRLENVAEIVAYQGKCFDGTGVPNDEVSGERIPIGARVLKVASDFELALKSHGDSSEAMTSLHERTGHYDTTVLEALHNALLNGLCSSSQRDITISELRVGMVLAADIRSSSNASQLMVTRGQTITETVKQKLQTLCQNSVIEDHCSVEVLASLETSST